MKIELTHNKGIKWYKNEFIHFKGYFYDQNNQYYHSDKAICFFSQIKNYDDFLNTLININGSFAVVVINENEIWSGVDHSRSIPLYFSKNKELIISDNVESIINTTSINKINETSVLEIKYIGACLGNKTLFDDIFQLMAGQALLIIISTQSTIIETYYSHFHTYSNKNDYNKLLIDLDKCINNVFERLIKSLDGRTVVIPLSGGLDSRLIVSMLKKLNYPNIVCYAYGTKNSFEVEISKKVANKLGLKWYYIEYNKSLFNEYFNNESKCYRAYAGNYDTFPQEQEYFAVKSLKKQGLIPDDAIFIPGYCGDLPAGSYLPNPRLFTNIKTKQNSGIKFIQNKHILKTSMGSDYENVKNIIEEEVKSYTYNTFDDFVSEHENWFSVNKVSKNIVNYVRTFEFFEYEWRIPLWDKEFLNFFYTLPNLYRIDKYLYRNYLKQYLYSLYDIDFEHYSFKNNVSKKLFIQNLKALIPIKIFKSMKKIYKNNDINNSEILFDMINQTIFKNKFEHDIKNLNFILSSWYLSEIETTKNEL